jgi:hypothetical protein
VTGHVRGELVEVAAVDAMRRLRPAAQALVLGVDDERERAVGTAYEDVWLEPADPLARA